MAIVYQNGVAGKVCVNPECGWKPLSEFPTRRVMGMPAGDGYKSRCRECWNAQSRAEYAANIDKYRAAQQNMSRQTKSITVSSSVSIKQKILRNMKKPTASI